MDTPSCESTLAFMSGGSTPGRGPYGDRVGRCVDYLLANTQPSGFIQNPGSSSHGPMYGHGFATMFLAECYGMSPREELRQKLVKAVKMAGFAKPTLVAGDPSLGHAVEKIIERFAYGAGLSAEGVAEIVSQNRGGKHDRD